MLTAPDGFRWRPNPGPQTAAFQRSERELLYGGARGGGKTEFGIVAMMLPALEFRDDGRPAFPFYQGLVLRRHAQDLQDWNARAIDIYRHFGAKQIGRPPFYRFPGGQTIYTGHLRDMRAVSNYLGSQYQKMLVEEVTLLPQEGILDRLLGSLRSIHPDLAPQLFMTTNPGGPGHQWVRSRYVRVYDENGKRIPAGMPYKDPKTGWWRIFVPARVEDNPFLYHNDPGYVRFLDGLEEALRKAWRDGDWDSFAGQFFSEFRPEGPIGGEDELFPWANHVIDSREANLQPWWYRWGSGDWGYDHPAAFHWYCQTDTDQVHVYRERIDRQKSPTELGVMIAEASLQDLENLPEPHIQFSIDPMAWRVVDDAKTIAQRMADGIEMVLGKGAANILKRDGTPLEVGREIGLGEVAITLRPAVNDRASGWTAVREALRWRPLFKIGIQDESLPMLQIHGDQCPVVVDTLPVLVYSETRPEDCEKIDAVEGIGGDDAADSLRYGIMAHKLRQNVIPVKAYLAEKMMDLSKRYDGNPDPTIVAMVTQHHLHKYKQLNAHTRPVNFRRSYGRRLR